MTAQETPDMATARVGEGSRLIEAGDYVGAEAAFREAIRLDGRYVAAHVGLGWALLDLNQNLEAGAAFKTAVDLHPGEPGAHEGLGCVLLREERFPAAEDEFREAVRLDPGSGVTCCRLGEAMYRQGRYMDAEIAFRDAIRADSGSAKAHAWLGWALRQLLANAEAEQAFRMAISLDPGSSGGRLGLGAALWDAKRFAEAEAEFREAVRIDPSNARAHHSLGRLLSKMNRYPEAEAEFRVAVSLDPANTEAQQDLAQLVRAREDRDTAGHYRSTSAWPGKRLKRNRRPQAGRNKPDPKVLRRCPRARAVRRFAAGFVDDYMIPATVLFSVDGSYWDLVFPVGMYVLNGYLEGMTGQSVGKILTGLYTIHPKTGKFIGGSKGITRRLLHVFDYFTVAGWVIGLFSGQTCADAFIGTVVVWCPRQGLVEEGDLRRIYAMEREQHRRDRRRAGLAARLFWAAIRYNRGW